MPLTALRHPEATFLVAAPVYRPELDALRFLAFLCVFLHHWIGLTLSHPSHSVAGYLLVLARNTFGFGLQLFFTLSAFLITDLLLREREMTGKVAILAFYKRRMLRIWPLYFLAIVLGLIWSFFLGSAFSGFALAALLFAGNWFANFNGWGNNPFEPTWSISIEEQFYLLWPLIAAKGSRRTMYAFAGALISSANLWLIGYGMHHVASEVRPWTNSFVEFQMFAAGIILAVVLRHRSPRLGAKWRAILFLTAGSCWGLAVFPFHAKIIGATTSTIGYIAGYALITIGCVLFLLTFLGIKGVPTPIVYLGKISYGLYIYHLAAILLLEHFKMPLLVRLLAAVGTTIVIASISYRWYEKPFLKLKARAEVIPSRPA